MEREPEITDFTTPPPEDQGTIIDQMMKERRRKDALRTPNNVNVSRVRSQMYALLRDKEKWKNLDVEAKKRLAKQKYPEIATKFTSLFDLAITETDNDEFKTVLNLMLQNISAVQQGAMSIANCTDKIEWELGKRYCKPKTE